MRICRAGLGRCRGTDLKESILFGGDSWPFWVTVAIGASSFSHARPIAGHLLLDPQIGVVWLVLSLPSKQECMLDRVDRSQFLLHRVVLQTVIKKIAINRLCLRSG